MIKKILILFLLTFSFSSQFANAQCASFATNACTSAAPTVLGNSVTCTPPNNNAGRRNFLVTNMIAGATYQVSNCGSGQDTQMTIRDLANTVVGFNDDNGPACFGTAASIDFVPPATGDYRIQLNRWNCQTAGSLLNGDILVTLIADPAPPLTNDDPCGAIALTVNAACTFATYSSVGATATTGVPAPGCASYSDNDVWFSVTVPASGNITIDTDTGSITDGGMAIYSGTCGALTLIECDDDDSANGFMPSITRTGLTPGSTIFIRVWDYGDGEGTFDICATEPAPGPTNDDPCGAISLTVNPDFSCTSVTAGTIAGALDSGINACAGTEDDDVWYSFVATGANHTVELLNVAGSTTDLYHAVYGGFIAPDCSVAVGDNISCSDPNFSTITGLTIGETYFVQVFSWTATPGQNSTFDICIGTPPPPPPNDDPCGAISLTVNPDFLCANVTAGSVDSALDSGIDACFGTPDDDVWFSFVATGPSHTVDLINVSGSTTDLYHAVYGGFTAPDCSVTVGDNISCSDLDLSTLTGLVTGETYFVKCLLILLHPDKPRVLTCVLDHLLHLV